MRKIIKILSLDGGGIKGIIAGEILVSLERKLARQSGRKDMRLGEHFDFIAGTSTGGILAALLLCPDKSDPERPRFTAKQALELYYKHGGEIFDLTLWQKLISLGGLIDERYDASPLEKYLDEYFDNILMSELIKPCLITGYDIKNRSAKFFTQHDARKSRDRDYYLKDVVRATSAAPTYFELAEIKSLRQTVSPVIDGGVFANNPALCAYAEVREKFPKKPTAKDMLILSIGTGIDKTSYEYREAKDWGIVEWLRPLLNIMMSGVSETVDYQLRKIFESVGRSDQYLRVNSEILHADSAMDNASPANITALKKEGRRIAAKYRVQMNRFAGLMLQS